MLYFNKITNYFTAANMKFTFALYCLDTRFLGLLNVR